MMSEKFPFACKESTTMTSVARVEARAVKVVITLITITAINVAVST